MNKKIHKKFSPNKKRFATSLGLGIISAILTAMPGNTAETITVSFPPFKLDLSVESLEKFVETGEVTSELRYYENQLEPEEKENLRQLLRQRFEVSPSTVKTFTEISLGQDVMRRLGQIIRTHDGKNGNLALTKAFNQAAASEEGLTPLNLLKQYPGDIRLDLELSVQLVAELLTQVVENNFILKEIQQQAKISNNPPQFYLGGSPVRSQGRFQSKKDSFTFRNPNRARDSEIDFYLPQGSSENQIPVIVISHGFASDRSTFVYLAEHFASHGFAVAVPEHIDSNADFVEKIFAGFSAPVEADAFVNRPLDLTYLLDTIEERYESDPLWKGKLNLTEVGAIGQSFGGYTVLATAGAGFASEETLRSKCESEDPSIIFNISLLLQCRALEVEAPTNNLRDERITSVIAINPITSGVFGPEGMSKLQVPTMIVAGSEDIFAPPVEEQVRSFAGLTAPDKYLVVTKPGTHFSFIGTEEEEGVLPVPPELIGLDPKLAQPYMQALSTAFFKSYIQDEREFLAYLSESYLESSAEEPFSFALVTSFTLEQIEKAIENSNNQQEALFD
ncbi:MAG: alpha/beta hydrolase [Cyanobacteriota bacterium]|nr:alpha/beta hydrolase [Cyanobacteriota bacterium]